MAKQESVTSHELIGIIEALDEGKDFASLLLMACADLGEENTSPITRCVGEILGRMTDARRLAADAHERLAPALVQAA